MTWLSAQVVIFLSNEVKIDSINVEPDLGRPTIKIGTKSLVFLKSLTPPINSILL